MKIIYNDRLHLADSITPTSQDTTLPAVNALNDHIGKVWRTDATARDEYILIDMGASGDLAGTGAAILQIVDTSTDNIITSAPTTFKVEANNGGGNLVDQALTFGYNVASSYAAPRNWGFATFSNSNPIRYWKITFTKTAADHEIGRVYIGDTIVTAEKPEYTGYDEAYEDLTESTRADDGSTYSNIKPFYRRLNLEFREIAQADKDKLDLVFRTQGTGKPFIIQPDEDVVTDIFYVKFGRAPRFSVAGYDGGLIYDVDIDLVEEV